MIDFNRNRVPKQNMFVDQISAIILAAGFSSRMGRFKPLLAAGEKTVLELAARPFKKAGIKDLRVVTGYQAQTLSEVIRQMGAIEVFNPDFQQGMFSSVVAGITSLEPDCRAFFVLPVDIPLVRPRTLQNLLAAFQQEQGKIIYPRFETRRGHPPLISAEYVQALRLWQGEGGLGGFLKARPDMAFEVPVADEFILFDIDNQQDYHNFLGRLNHAEIPTFREGQFILRQMLNLDEPLIQHSLKVARVSRIIGQALNENGMRLKLELLTAAALLHDLARAQPRHALKAAAVIEEMGFSPVAEIVRYHMDLVVEDDCLITEKEILYIADKLVRGNQVVGLSERFNLKARHYKDNPKAQAAIAQRLKTAQKIAEGIKRVTGKTLENLLAELDHKPNEPPDEFSDVS